MRKYDRVNCLTFLVTPPPQVTYWTISSVCPFVTQIIRVFIYFALHIEYLVFWCLQYEAFFAGQLNGCQKTFCSQKVGDTFAWLPQIAVFYSVCKGWCTDRSSPWYVCRPILNKAIYKPAIVRWNHVRKKWKIVNSFHWGFTIEVQYKLYQRKTFFHVHERETNSKLLWNHRIRRISIFAQSSIDNIVEVVHGTECCTQSWLQVCTK